MKRIIFPLLLVFLTVSCTLSPKPLYIKDFFALDTFCTVTVYEGGDDRVLDDAVSFIQELSDLISIGSENGKVALLNRGEQVDSDPYITELLEKAYYFQDISGGLFSVSSGTLTKLWKTAMEKGTPPTDSDVKDALSGIKEQSVITEDGKISLADGVQLDFGAIGKGFIAEKCETFLRERGVSSAVINLGGNISIIGKYGKEDFTVGIEYPFGKDGQLAGKLYLSDTSAVTSGIYERYFEHEGNLFHHIIDLNTGYPVQNDLYSVTVISQNSADADALSTCCFVMESEDALRLIESIPDTEAIFITKDYKIIKTSGIGSKIRFEE